MTLGDAKVGSTVVVTKIEGDRGQSLGSEVIAILEEKTMLSVSR